MSPVGGDPVNGPVSWFIPPIDEYLENLSKSTITPEQVKGYLIKSEYPNKKIREKFG